MKSIRFVRCVLAALLIATCAEARAQIAATPAADLSDIGADANYFPDGIPTNPTSGAAYSLNATTHRVN